jgi:hypothetical protein
VGVKYLTKSKIRRNDLKREKKLKIFLQVGRARSGLDAIISDAVQKHKVMFPVGRSTSTPAPKVMPNADVNTHRLMAGSGAFGQL